MLIPRFLSVTVIFSSFLVGDVISTPIGGDESIVDLVARSSSTGHANVPDAPRFVLHANTTKLPEPAEVKGFNVLKLGYIDDNNKQHGSAQTWLHHSGTWRKQHKQAFQKAGIKTVTISVSDKAAIKFAGFLHQHPSSLDGIDIHLGYPPSQDANTFTKDYVRKLIKALPDSISVITVTLDASWFEPDITTPSIHDSVGSLIDWYNIQYFNPTNGNDDYRFCSTLLERSSDAHPKTGVYELLDRGIPMDKIVIGKHAPDDKRHMSATTLESCLSQALHQRPGWTIGVAGFRYPGANAKWIKTVRAESWPV